MIHFELLSSRATQEDFAVYSLYFSTMRIWLSQLLWCCLWHGILISEVSVLFSLSLECMAADAPSLDSHLSLSCSRGFKILLSYTAMTKPKNNWLRMYIIVDVHSFAEHGKCSLYELSHVFLTFLCGNEKTPPVSFHFSFHFGSSQYAQLRKKSNLAMTLNGM